MVLCRFCSGPRISPTDACDAALGGHVARCEKFAPQPDLVQLLPMAAVTIRNLSEEAHRALKVRAVQHNRSAEAEMRAILEAAVRPGGDEARPAPWRP